MKLFKRISEILGVRSLVGLGVFSFIINSTILISAQLPIENKSPVSAVISPDLTSGEPVNKNGFRVERIEVPGGAELITIFARIGSLNDQIQTLGSEIPLVSVLKDTLGDDNPENDRLRYVWMLTYTRSSVAQKASAFVPFLYSKTTNKNSVGSEPPPPIIDVQSSDKSAWNSAFWIIFKKLVLEEVGAGVTASALQYRQNRADYRRSAVAGALTILSLYQANGDEKVLSESEMRDIQARLMLTDKAFGWHMQSEFLGRVYDKEEMTTRDLRGHNWELLRQYSEAQGLYFEPLKMPDGTARHAIVWVDAADIAANAGRKFDSRFLNIKSPWNDERLANWKGFSQERWFDADDRQVDSDTPNARRRILIPLALYGLDHPKIPIILVDFRDQNNPKMREMSKRILRDVSGSVISLSMFEGLPGILGKFAYDFVTGRRGMDLNQTSRIKAYSQLKLLLSLDESIDPELRREVAGRVESAALNPLENDADVELKLARAQYQNLAAYAKRPGGLESKIENDRREEMRRLKHGRSERAVFELAHLFSFGLYTHRESSTPDMLAQMDKQRQLDYHERVLREVALGSARPEIDSDVAKLRTSLEFLSQNGSAAKEKTTKALSRIFKVTRDEDMQTLCLASLYRINSPSAKKELVAIYNDTNIEDHWRNVCANYLKLALKEGQRMSARDAQVVAVMGSN